MKSCSLKLICLAAAALGPAIALAQSPPERGATAAVTALQRTLVDVIAQAEPSVVAITRISPPKERPGDGQAFLLTPFRDLESMNSAALPATTAAGVIIDPAGLVLTEYLAVRQDDTHTVVTTDGRTYPAEIKAADPRSGLAVLAIQPVRPRVAPRPGAPAEDRATPLTKFVAIRFGDADQLRKGQFVVALGNPYAIRSDGEPTASWGIVANLARKAPAGTNLNDEPGPLDDYRTTVHHLGTLIQTDAKLGWSAGGGALVDLDGALVGLTTTAATIAGHEQPAGYAIPINAAFRRIIDTLKDGREVEYGLLGVGLGPAEGPGTGPRRVVVQQIYQGGPGARAGLAPGDVVTGVAGKPVQDVDSLQLAVSLMPPSTPTTLEYERNGQRGTAEIKLAKLGVAGNKIVTNRRPAWHGMRIDYATALDAAALASAINSGALDEAGCVLVTEVEPESEAARAGMQPGMFISHVGASRVATPEEFYAEAEKLADRFDVRPTRPIAPAAEAGD